MDLSDFGIEKYDMRFLGRPRLETTLVCFVFWAGCLRYLERIYLPLLPPFIIFLCRRRRLSV